MSKWFNLGRKTKNTHIDAVQEINASVTRLDDDRAPPNLDAGSRVLAPGSRSFLIALILVALLLVSLLVLRMLSKKPESPTGRKATIGITVPNLDPLALRADPKPPLPEPPVSETPKEPVFDLSDPQPTIPRIDPITERQMLSGLQGKGQRTSQPSGQGTDAKRDDGRDSGPMADHLKPLRLSAASASLRADLNLVLTQGAMIDCVQQTRFVSAQAGMITCYTPREVRSANGRVVLIDPGTIFTGYQQSVLAHGQPRIAVVWSRLETPSGVVVHLDSPATGPLGEGGLDGEIDSHFADRFGGALLISLIGDLGDWIGNRGGGGNDTIRFDNSSDAAQEAVTTVLENSINIPPTLYRNQGMRLGIYVARDLDFSSVYALRPRLTSRDYLH